ncbi:MAG: hypothetical protein KAI94_06160 [Anaerolineales bacterium]|nr:hypothetical protein [Anaerolineales bacterium]
MYSKEETNDKWGIRAFSWACYSGLGWWYCDKRPMAGMIEEVSLSDSFGQRYNRGFPRVYCSNDDVIRSVVLSIIVAF